MKQVKIIIGEKSYTCDLFETEQEHKKGLMGVEYLPPDRGALFIWSEQQPVIEMWMKNTKIPLDQIAINDDDEVTAVYKAQPEDETLHPFPNAKYILDDHPIDEECNCPTCKSFSRAYVRHLLKAGEMLGMRLAVMHNLYFYNNLMTQIRENIENNSFEDFKNEYVDRLDTRI